MTCSLEDICLGQRSMAAGGKRHWLGYFDRTARDVLVALSHSMGIFEMAPNAGVRHSKPALRGSNGMAQPLLLSLRLTSIHHLLNVRMFNAKRSSECRLLAA